MNVTVSALPLGEVTARCRRAQRVWAELSVGERLRPVRALRRLLVERREAVCAAVGEDVGKGEDEALAAEVLPLADACRFLEKEAGRILKPRRVPLGQRPLWLWGQRDRVFRRPRGLVGLIGTWNYPVFLNGVALAQALTAGNGVVWKPSELAPASAAVLFGLVREAGWPEDLVAFLPATREMGKELAEADIDHVAFTGASGTGKVLAANLGRRLVTSTLELSGCDPLFVMEDGDAVLAARAAWFGATMNRGQTCLAVRRAFVHRRHYGEFVEALRVLAATARPGRLALEAQAEQARRLVAEAVAGGAKLLVEGDDGDGGGAECRPRVVVGARPEMAICREASFAPVLAVLPFDTVEEALAGNELCPSILAASVFTAEPERYEGLAGRLKAGTVLFNDVIVPTAHPATPFGGRGESGWGVTQGEEGLLEMTAPQVVGVRGGRFRPHYDLAVREDPAQGEMVRGLLEWGHAGGWGRRVRGLWRLIGAMRRLGRG